MNATIMQRTFFALLAATASGPCSIAADIEITETLQLPECHSLGWVRANAGVKGQPPLHPVPSPCPRPTRPGALKSRFALDRPA